MRKSSKTFLPYKLRSLITRTFRWNSWDFDSAFVGILPYSMTSSRSECLAPVPFAYTLTPFKSCRFLSRWKSKNLHKARRPSRTDDYTIMSRAHLLLSEDRKTRRNVLLWTILSRLIRLLRDFCHRKEDMNFFFLSFFMSLPQALLLLWWQFLLNTGLWQHDSEKKPRAPPLTRSRPFIHLSNSLFWTPVWFWQPYIADSSYESGCANKMLMN